MRTRSRVLFGLLTLGDVGLGLVLVRLGARAILDGEGTGEGIVGLIAMAAGATCLLIAAFATVWTVRGPQRLHPVVAVLFASLPMMALTSWYWPDRWWFPPRVKVWCYEPAPKDPAREVGIVDSGVRVVVPLLQNNRDFIYVLPPPGPEFPVDCTPEDGVPRARCVLKRHSEAELRRALSVLPTCGE